MADTRIKDLAAFSGTPTPTDFLAIDGPNETKKIPSTTFALLENTFYKNATYIDDCDNALVTSKWSYNTQTANTPVDGYGILLTFSSVTNPSAQYLWTFQLAITTGALPRMFLRSKINEQQWSKWKEFSVGPVLVQTFQAVGKTWVFRRVGEIAFLEAPADCNGFAAGSQTLFTLPEEFRPNNSICVAPGNVIGDLKSFLSINTTGEVILYCSRAGGSSAENFSFSTSYVVKV